MRTEPSAKIASTSTPAPLVNRPAVAPKPSRPNRSRAATCGVGLPRIDVRWTQSDASPLGSKATKSLRPSPSTSATSETTGLAAQSVSQYWPRLRAYPSLAQAEAATSHAVTIPENPPMPSRNALRPIVVGTPGCRPVSNVARDEYEVKVGELSLRSGADIDAKARFYGLPPSGAGSDGVPGAPTHGGNEC